jgi:bifunctional DNA-binding transcriptional regulator/antitoxin component of YhaV-PrlF toxin-antitoxin module
MQGICYLCPLGDQVIKIIMKVTIYQGKIYIPKQIREKVNLPDNGECEIQLGENEIRIKINKEEIKYQEGDPILSLTGLGREIWEGVDPDEYVRNLREGWK